MYFVLTFNCCKKDCISRIYKVFEIYDAIKLSIPFETIFVKILDIIGQFLNKFDP